MSNRPTGGARRRTVLLMLTALLVAGGRVFRGQLQALEASLVPGLDGVESVIRSAALAMLVPVFLLAAYLWWLATRVLIGGRYPPSRTWLLRDVPVREGAAARAWGYVLLVCGVLVAATGFTAIFIMRRI
jgi:hypothetical protein